MRKIIFTFAVIFTTILAVAQTPSSIQKKGGLKCTKYLFAYFTSDTKEGQQVCFALSDNGLDFTPINGGKPVLSSDEISVSGGVRDPHILCGEDGIFRMVLTDMDMSKGKWTGLGIILLTSEDLIHWKSSTVWFPNRYEGTDFANVNAVWAPQTIFDPTAGRYMVYFSLHSEKGGPFPTDVVYFAYANEAFTDLEGEPQRLFEFDGPTIDTDIVLDENGLYHLFFNTWGNGGTQRRQYIISDLHNQSSWDLVPGHMQPNNKKSEGSTAYQLADGRWILCYDCFATKEFQFCTTPDWRSFTLLKSTSASDDFNPKHGSVIRITSKEDKRLRKAFK